MAGGVRKSESLWDMEEDMLPPTQISEVNPWPGKERHSRFRGGNSSKWSDSEANNAMKSDDISGRSSWELLPGNSNMLQDDDIDRNRRRMAPEPALDGRGHHYNSRSSDDGLNLPHRVRGRASVRSRSRSRGRDQSRSRSRSRGRSRNQSRSRSKSRGKARGMGRSRSRSRSRSRGWGGGITRARSRSPFRDDRRESYEHIDARSGPRISSRPCKDFALGKCRRGSQCKFFHQENLDWRIENHLEDNSTERCSRPEHPGALRYSDNTSSADRLRNKVSDGYKRYSGADEPERDRVKDTFCCKDFLKGRCLRGASCRYSHHVASDDNYIKGNRNAYDDEDSKPQPNRNGKVPCKFFLMGKCHRDNCRFAHEDSSSGGFDGRPRDDKRRHYSDDKEKSWNGPSWDEEKASVFSDTVKSNHKVDDKNNSWNGPSWDEVSASGFSDLAKSNYNLDDKNRSWNGPSWDEVTASDFSDIAKSSGWGGSSVGNPNFHDPEVTEKRTGDGWDHGSENKSRKWDGPGQNEKAALRSHHLSPQWASASDDADLGTNEFRGMDTEKPQIIADGSQSQNLDGIFLHAHERHIMPEASGYQLAAGVMRPMVSEVSYIEQHDSQGVDNIAMIDDNNRQGQDNVAMIDDYNTLSRDMVSENTNHQVLTPGTGFIQNGHSMGSQSSSSLGGSEQSRFKITLSPSNRPNIELNGQVKDVFFHLNPQKQTNVLKNDTGKPQEVLEVRTPQLTPEMHGIVASSEQVAQLTSLLAPLAQISQNRQLPQSYADLNPTNAMRLAHSFPTAGSAVLHMDPMVARPNPDTRSKEQCDPGRENLEISKDENKNESLGLLSSSAGQENQMPLEQSSPIATGDSNFIKPQPSGFSKVENKKSPRLEKQEAVANPEINESNVPQKPKQEQENMIPGSLNARGKVEEGNMSNDEKAMRLFKVALVEFVKDILKPTWKEGRMSREVHKTIVKKVVDKVTSTIQGVQIPRTQEKIDQYLAFSKPKITKLAEAYMERLLKG